MTAIGGQRRGSLSLPSPAVATPDTHALLDVLHAAADAVADALAAVDDRRAPGTRAGQYGIDLVADAVALPALRDAGLAVLSEESGLSPGSTGLLAVLDPVDGSTNASRGIPWYATSICVLDDEGPLVALVADQATPRRFTATRGGGAFLDGVPVRPSDRVELGDAIVALSGYPARYLGWRQFRALGAAALDLCSVAAGVVDAYVDCSVDAHGPWDYLAGLLVCTEAGAIVTEAHGRELVVRGHGDRRTPVAAATPALAAAVLGALA
jgi:fructose-1,6-bisphosphatase/inositol monophosphatase family enzyme